MELNNLSDIYAASVGDKLLFGKDQTEESIYSELVSNKKWATMSANHMGHNVFEIMPVTDVKNSTVVKHVSEAMNDDDFAIDIPLHLNLMSVRAALYLCVKGYKMSFVENRMTLTKRVKDVTLEVFTDDFKKGSARQVSLSGLGNVNTALTKLYFRAKKEGIKIKIENFTNFLKVTHRGLIDTTTTIGVRSHVSFTRQVNKWLDTVEYDKEVTIPDYLLCQKPIGDVIAVLHKSKYDCKYRKGQLTKRSVLMRKRLGKIEVMYLGEVKHTINKPSLSHISNADRKKVDEILSPYGFGFEDARS